MWSFYPVVWLFSEGFASFSVSFEVRLNMPKPSPTLPRTLQPEPLATRTQNPKPKTPQRRGDLNRLLGGGRWSCSLKAGVGAAQIPLKNPEIRYEKKCLTVSVEVSAASVCQACILELHLRVRA